MRIKDETLKALCAGFEDGDVLIAPKTLAPDLAYDLLEARAELERWRALGARVTALEMGILQRMKGDDERHVRELIWAAHDILHPNKDRPEL